VVVMHFVHAYSVIPRPLAEIHALAQFRSPVVNRSPNRHSHSCPQEKSHHTQPAIIVPASTTPQATKLLVGPRRDGPAACESRCRAIHPEIPLCGIEGLRPSLPPCQPGYFPATSHSSRITSALTHSQPPTLLPCDSTPAPVKCFGFGVHPSHRCITRTISCPRNTTSS